MFARKNVWVAVLALGAGSILGIAGMGSALAVKVADTRNTKHNLSITGPGTVKAEIQTGICVFCHTPHGATPGITPLWNRKLSSATYTPYTSTSLDAETIQGSLDQPGGSSKLCLSCHDGTMAIGNVNVLGGQGSPTQQGTMTITLFGTDPGDVMPAGAGTATGFTRNLGVDLRNDHPISVTFDSVLAAADGELRPVDAFSQKWPAGGTVVGVRSPGYKPLLPLEATGAGGKGQVQCGTCHDAHVHETDPAKGDQKFLRAQRFQEVQPTNSYDQNSDIVCLGCHDKNIGSGTWAYSAHANPLVADQVYLPTPAAQRDFPDGLPVWKAACMNCHDTHTVQGARRLLREGTDSFSSPKTGGNPAVEETCYQCHTTDVQSVITPSAGSAYIPSGLLETVIPDIKTDFTSVRHMPITNIEQGVMAEAHDIGFNSADTYVDCTVTANTRCGKDFIEPRQRLGETVVTNRHAECTDCHNPHRVVKFRSFVGGPGGITGAPDAAGTHNHAAGHTNIASGVLRGMWGVEPVYSSASFQNLPSNYTVKRGDPGNSVDTATTAAYVTREYQICLKCHSDYGYSDNNIYPVGNRPGLGDMLGGTPFGANGMTQYTNQAKEFQAPLSHKGEVTTADSGAGAGYVTNNHRSWHPVIDNTGRDVVTRGNMDPTSFLAPWNGAADVGMQTMYCSDCHGSNTALGTVVPDGGENGKSWGPHGSSNDFILKGLWNQNVGIPGTEDSLCFRCHDWNQYANPNPPDTDATIKKSGFCCAGFGGGLQFGRSKNLHLYHANRLANFWMGKWRCSKCHVAVPHGWKNKAFLANLNDIGPEAGQPAGTVAAQPYNVGPYYMNTWLKVSSFARSGNWTVNNCGGFGGWMFGGCGNAP